MNPSKEFEIALSFAGEDREYVEQVANLLKNSDVNVFYDGFEEEKLWGKNLYDYLSDIYMNKASYTIMFISKHYEKRLWTNHERQAMQARAFQESQEYILPARFDKTPIPGNLETVGYISLENRSPKEFVEIILKKLEKSESTMSNILGSKNVDELNGKPSKGAEYPSFNISNHTSKKITIIGAAGDVGKQIINRLILQQILLPRDKLQLIEKTGQFSLLKGLSLDFADAYASYLPNIEVISNPEEIDGDIIVMAAGVPNTDIRQDRSDLAKFNKSIFERYAKNISPNSHAFVIVVSNPIELGVDIFAHSDNFDRKKILGIGAFHDTLRFRREIAKNLDIPRSHVNAFVIGTHSRHMIPLWSTLRVLGKNNHELLEYVDSCIKQSPDNEECNDLVDKEMQKIINMLDERQSIDEAIDSAMQTTPDIRIHLIPRILQEAGSKTIFSTTNAVITLIQHIIKGRNILMPAQVLLKKEDEYYGIKETIPFGVPILLTPMGWEAINTDEPSTTEQCSIEKSVQRIILELEKWRKITI